MRDIPVIAFIQTCLLPDRREPVSKEASKLIQPCLCEVYCITVLSS